MRTAFLFPGQGSQYVGMGAVWYRASAEARVLYERANTKLGYSLSDLCFEGPQEMLDNTEFTQPAVFVTSMAMWTATRNHLPSPDVVAGHSLGEFTALVVSGAMSFGDALDLVSERGRLMSSANVHEPGGMAVLLGATFEAAESLCEAASQAVGEPLVVANDNCPGQVVISGAVAALDRAIEMAPSYNIRRARSLAVSVAAHSPLMSGVQGDFAHLLETASIQMPEIPVVLNVTAGPAQHPDTIRQALLLQLISPVRWREGVQWMAEQGVQSFVEVGPKNILGGLVRRTVVDSHIEALDENTHIMNALGTVKV